MQYKKPGKYLSKPYVTLDNVQLKSSDYTFKYYEGEITDDTAEGVKELTSRDKLTLSDDETSKTITIVATGKGNYTGKAYGYYEVVKPADEKINLTKARIVAKDKNSKNKDVSVGKQEYTGYAITPAIRVQIKVGKVWQDVDENYYSVNYINNRNKGTATIIVNGNGDNATGSRKATFRITTMRMSLFERIFGMITG
ncbi:MAG: hypothetical protein IJ695_08585 [Butyrivibrio sp.]|nr:hypothetical protein [Butyrivibrio sp.]